jgi:propanol-preferring alcohol dehydrogenase
VVIGAGGLGHVAVQILRSVTAATVVALDVSPDKRDLATTVGAHHVFDSNPAATDAVRALTGGRGAHAVFDFVANQDTITLAHSLARVHGDLVLVGVGAGSLPVGVLAMPYDCSVRAPYWGSRSELFEVLELARAGAIHVETEVFPLDAAPEAYQRLHDGTLRGRAVVVP